MITKSSTRLEINLATRSFHTNFTATPRPSERLHHYDNFDNDDENSDDDDDDNFDNDNQNGGDDDDDDDDETVRTPASL